MQQDVDDAAMAEHRHGVLVVGGGHDVGDRSPDPGAESVLVHAAGQVAVSHSGPVLGTLGPQQFHRHVGSHVAVVFG